MTHRVRGVCGAAAVRAGLRPVCWRNDGEPGNHPLGRSLPARLESRRRGLGHVLRPTLLA